MKNPVNYFKLDIHIIKFSCKKLKSYSKKHYYLIKKMVL